MPHDPGEKPKEEPDVLEDPDQPKPSGGGFKDTLKAIPRAFRRNYKLLAIAAILGAGAIGGTWCVSRSCEGCGGCSCSGDAKKKLLQDELDRIRQTPRDQISVGLTLTYDPSSRSVGLADTSTKTDMDGCGEPHDGTVKRIRGTRLESGGILQQDLQIGFSTHNAPHCYGATTYLENSDFVRTSTKAQAAFPHWRSWVPDRDDVPFKPIRIAMSMKRKNYCE